MHTKPIQPVTHFLRAEGGSAALEFVIVAPAILLLMFAIIEFSLIMLVNNIMESSTNISSRLGKTGFSAGGQTREETILASVADRVGTLIDTDDLTVTTKVYAQFDQIGDAEPWTDTNGNGLADVGEYDDINGNGTRDLDMARAGYGNAQDIVVYTISYPWSIQTPLMRELIGDETGIFDISAKAVVKNEPYDD